MTKAKLLCMALVVAAAVAAAPLANAAPTVHFVAAGSSAMFQGFGVAVINDVAGTNVHHWTTKGNCGGGPGGHCADISDARPGVGDHQSATFWVAWQCSSAACNNNDATDIWLYAQVDSTVGVREFLARPSGVVAIANPAPAGQNLLPNGLLIHNTDGGDVLPPTDVQGILSGGVSVTVGMTDIRFEDAFYATQRVINGPYNADGGIQKLGYGEGVGIQGATSIGGIAASSATAYQFALPGGTDPHSGTAVPKTITTLSVGEEPILFLVNRTNAAGLGLPAGSSFVYNNVITNYNSPVGTANPLGQLFGGVNCNGNAAAFGSLGHNFAVYPILREALSGTMNTTEYSAFNTFGGKLPTVAGSEVGNSPLDSPSTSQEAGTPPNPLDAPGNNCAAGSGARYREIGTGNSVNGVKAKQDSIGYAFFSFANVSGIAGSGSYGYLQVDGIDPLYATYTNGQLPSCTAGTNCDRNSQWPGGAYFPNLVNGKYRVFSLLRAVCDSTTASCNGSDASGIKATIQKAQQDIHNGAASNSVADFLPFDDAGAWNKPFGDAVYVRSHYYFNSAFATGTNNQFPNKSHTAAPAAPLSITTDYSAVFGDPAGTDVIADLPSDTNAVGVPEAGGDAGGCLINAADTGALMKVQAAGYPAPVDGKIKFYVSAVAGTTQPHGVCDALASAPATPGMTCTTSYSAPVVNVSCGTVSTCNPVSTGDSMVVTGLSGTGSNGQPGSIDNGVFQITRFVNPGQIKVKAPIGRAGDPAGGGANNHYANLPPTTNGFATFNTGCAQ